MNTANDDTRLCPTCGAPVTGRADRKFCCYSCKKKSQARRHPRLKAEYTCRHCQVRFHPKESGRTTFCSRSCSQEHRTANASGQKPYVQTPMRSCLCEVCGATFESKLASRTCSKSCGIERERRRVRQIANDNHSATPRTCAECGNDFTPAYGARNRIYCSKPCLTRSSRRATKQRRRARIRSTATEAVYAMVVFERDGWKCMICGIDTPRSKRGSCWDDAPELDHITPLSRGGAHTYANTQCSCRNCNLEKSDNLPTPLAA
jgi:hypothetical protein